MEAALCGFDARCALVTHAVTSALVVAIAVITAEAACEAAMKREVKNVNRGSRYVVSGEVSAQVCDQRAGLSSRAASSALSSDDEGRMERTTPLNSHCELNVSVSYIGKRIEACTGAAARAAQQHR